MMKSSAQNTRAGFGDRFIAFANKVSDVSGLVAAYLLVPLVVVFLIEIVSRNVFNHPRRGRPARAFSSAAARPCSASATR